jgi:hypothetical protein
VNTRSKHDRLSCSSIIAFQRIAAFIPEGVPLILEAVIDESDIESEVQSVKTALPTSVNVAWGHEEGQLRGYTPRFA